MQVGKTAPRQRTDQVQRRGAGRIGAQHPRRIGYPGLCREIETIDDVTAIAGQRHAIPDFGVGRTRLGILSGHPPHLHHLAGGSVGQHHRHLQHHAEGLAGRHAIQRVEAFGAVAPLQQEGPARRHLGQLRPQPLHLAGKDQRRKGLQLTLHVGQRLFVRIGRHLATRPRTPGRRRPVRLRFRNAPGGMRGYSCGRFGTCRRRGRGSTGSERTVCRHGPGNRG